VLGDFVVDSLLYEGRHARVYLGHNPRGKPVAVKELHADSSQDAAQRFAREGELLRRLRHPNVVHVLAQGLTDAGLPVLVMEYLAGQSLEIRLEEQGPLPWRQALGLMLGVLDGLDAAHAAGIVHRNIKPEKIVLVPTDAGETAKIVDWRFAKDATEDPAERQRYRTSIGFVVGTPAYMAPEQLLGEPADARTDVYSAGLLLYEVLTGRVPFPAGTMVEVVQRAAMPVPPPVAPEGMEPFPQSLTDAIIGAVAPERMSRTMSARLFANQLRATLREEDSRF
jgi:serine/threonine-protein kinase